MQKPNDASKQSDKSSKPDSKPAAAKAASRNTDSAPSASSPVNSNDPAVQKMVQTGNLAAGMPFNANKPLEHGFGNGINPQPGARVEPESRLPGGSTLTEGKRHCQDWQHGA